MPTQMEILEGLIQRTEQSAPDSPSLSHLRTQLASMKRQAAQRAGTESPRENPVSFSVGMQSKTKG